MSKRIALVYHIQTVDEDQAHRSEFSTDGITHEKILTKIWKYLELLQVHQELTSEVRAQFARYYQLKYVGENQTYTTVDDSLDLDNAILQAKSTLEILITLKNPTGSLHSNPSNPSPLPRAESGGNHDIPPPKPNDTKPKSLKSLPAIDNPYEVDHKEAKVEEVKLEITGIKLENQPESIQPHPQINPGYLFRADGKKIRVFQCQTHQMSEQQYPGLPVYAKEGGEQFIFMDHSTLFISGGTARSGETLRSCFTINIIAKSCTVKRDMQNARKGHGLVEFDRQIYAFGGYSPTLKSAETYNSQSDQWNFLPSIPVEGGHISCVRVNEYILFTSWEFNLIRYTPNSNEYVNIGLDERGDASPSLLGPKTLVILSNELYIFTKKSIHNITVTGQIENQLNGTMQWTCDQYWVNSDGVVYLIDDREGIYEWKQPSTPSKVPIIESTPQPINPRPDNQSETKKKSCCSLI